MRIFLARNTYILLAMLGLLAILSFASVSVAEAADKPHSLRGIAHGTSVELFWKPPTTALTVGHRYTVIRRLEGQTRSEALRCNLEWSGPAANPAETWTDTGACDITVAIDTLNEQNEAYHDAAGLAPGKYIYNVKINKGGDPNNDSSSTSYYKAIVIGSERTMAGKYSAYQLRASANNNAVHLRWKVVSTHRVGGYQILRKTKGSNWETLFADTNSRSWKFTDTTADSGQTYAYSVKARYRPAGCNNNGCEELGIAASYAQVTQ